MRSVESGPQARRLVIQGITRGVEGQKEKIVFENPGAINIVRLRGQAYVEKGGILTPASDEVLVKLRELELKRGR